MPLFLLMKNDATEDISRVLPITESLSWLTTKEQRLVSQKKRLNKPFTWSSIRNSNRKLLCTASCYSYCLRVVFAWRSRDSLMLMSRSPNEGYGLKPKTVAKCSLNRECLLELKSSKFIKCFMHNIFQEDVSLL